MSIRTSHCVIVDNCLRIILPMKTNKNKKNRYASGKLNGRELSIEITGLTNTGDGIGRFEQQVVFVRHTMPGDEVRVRVAKDKGTFLIADLLEVVTPSNDRVRPSCEYFGECGGCDWMHIPYELQLVAKAEQFTETLHRIGGLTDIEIEEIIASPKQLNYRNRIQGQLRGGVFHFKQKGSNKLIAIKKCEIADELINKRFSAGFDEMATGKVEISVSDQKIDIVPLNSMQSTDLGFRQVNTEMGQILTELVLTTLTGDALSGEKVELINDLYCGRGDWTNAIAQLMPCATVLGVDSMPENITLARSRAASAGLKNVEYLQANVEEALGKVKVKNSFCIVDPPRAGLDAAVSEALCRRPAKELVYVSCHAATLSRDLKILTNGAYKVTLLQPLDMFPQTAHLESVVRLQAR